MKYKNLMDIPDGYEMQLSEDFGEYPKGTKVIRGHFRATWNDESSVSFTFPDGSWEYLNKDEIEEIPKEKKCMKGSDKVMVELTGYQVAKLYAVLGSCNGDLEYETRPSLYSQVRDLLGLSSDFWVGHFLKRLPLINFYGLEENLYKAVLEPETPVLTEAQKKALELKETIAKAQKQLEELEKEIA